MSDQTVRFSLNHMVYPSWSAMELIESAIKLGVGAVELRNDLPKNSLFEIESAQAIGLKAAENDIEILSINALYPFNIWNKEREEQAINLAKLGKACGAKGLVLCPMNDKEYHSSDEDKKIELYHALSNLKVILEKYDLKGFIEPLGFSISSIRFKKDVVEAITHIKGEDCFSLVHDTFHHCGAGEIEIFPLNTGLVHISGVEDESVSFDNMLDAHRVLVGPKDRLGNISQMRQLLDSGYQGLFSFEPFSKEILALEDPLAAVQESMEYIQKTLITA